MIRHAKVGDLDACLWMAREFFNESGFSAETEFDGPSMRSTLLGMIQNPDAALLVAGDEPFAMAGALAYPHYFNVRQKAAQELFWWVRPDKRGGPAGVRLLRELESWARAKGCTTLTMICLPALKESPAERVYQRSGYRAAERGYIKGL